MRATIGRAGVAIPKFAELDGGAVRISESLRHTSKYLLLMCFMDLKFAPGAIQGSGELQIQHISARRYGAVRVSSQIQLTSHVLPPSAEKACCISASLAPLWDHS